MPATYDRVLRNRLIKTVRLDVKNGIVQVRFANLPQIVTIAVIEENGRYGTWQDHGVRTPLQADLYRVRQRLYQDPEDALREALETFCFYCRLAIRRGFEPHPAWLVPL